MDINLLKIQFQNQEIAEVFVEYDGPRIYSFYTPNRGFYLAYSLDDAADHSEWLYVSTNQFRIFQLLAREISIRKFVLDSEASYQVKVNAGHQIESVAPGYAETKIPADSVMLKADFDYVTFALGGAGISPFSISESDFTNILSNIRSGTVKAMKALQAFVPGRYGEPSAHIFGAPICAPGSLKMLVRVESDRDLLRDTLKVSTSPNSQSVESEFGLSTNQVKEVQNTFFSIAPPLRSRGNVFYESVAINSSLLTSDSAPSITLDQSHKRQALDFAKSLQSSQDVVVVQGTVMRAAKDRGSFTLQKITFAPPGLTEIECFIDQNEQELFDSLVASSDELRQCDSPAGLVAKLLEMGSTLKVGGILKGPRLEVSSVKIVS